MNRVAIASLSAAMALLVAASPALASWGGAGTGGGGGYSRARALPAGNQPTASVTGRNVTVNWTAPTGGAPPAGYVVRRYTPGGVEQPIGSGCNGVVSATSCTEPALTPGQWRYTVTPANGNWRGAQSPQSAIATVGSPALTITSPTITSLPATKAGQITNFIQGQSVTYRLDDQTSGTLLSGSITPASVPANGTATVSVTIPNTVANGAHTVYAIGSSGDVAAYPVTVAVPMTVASSAWNLGDASSGTEANASYETAFANDARTYTTGNAATAFSTSRYLLFDYNAVLPSNSVPTAASFNFRFADPVASGTACFYFDVRRASTNAVIATHGSSSSPVGCVTGTAQQAFATPLPEVTSSAIANDLRVRVYVRESGSRGLVVDRSTMSVTVAAGTGELYPEAFTDRATGSNTTRTWGLVSGSDSVYYQSASTWPTSFTASRYLELAFPAYVPATASVSDASLQFSYRSVTSGTTCWYFQVLQGTTVIATHGSTSAPVSCNTSRTTWVTDDVALPEINTPTRADQAVVKVYMRSSASRQSQINLAQLTIDYQ